MRNDGVSKLYKPSQIMDKINKGLFALNIICVVLSCILSDTPLQVTRILQIVFSLSFVIIEILDDGIFWYEAERIRRTNCIQDAFQINLTEYKTTGYYNNDLTPSFSKYAINTFESHFFTTNISRRMLPKKIVEVIVALLIFVVSCLLSLFSCFPQAVDDAKSATDNPIAVIFLIVLVSFLIFAPLYGKLIIFPATLFWTFHSFCAQL